MRKKRLITGVLASLFALGVAGGTLWGLGVFADVTDYRPVPAGHQEVVFLAPATSGDSWERLVAAVDVLHEESKKTSGDKPRLRISKESAFTDLTADVPEVSLWFEGHQEARLWIRWYKLSADFNTEKWIARLLTRKTPPLAIIGGETSYRALQVAEVLQRERNSWHGSPPLFFITTATIDRYVPIDIAFDPTKDSTTDEKWPKLMDVYQGLTFRFSFTNSRMATAVVDFVRNHENLFSGTTMPADVTAAGAGAAVLAAGGEDLFATYLYTLKWADDNFSADLADRFGLVFLDKFRGGRVSPNQIEYSVGDFYQPNPREAFVVGQILPELKAARQRRQLMLLPANADRMRRFLRTVVRRSAPQDLKNLIVLTGDSLNFNTIYRDGNVAWNIQDLPVPLVLFSHRNPASDDAGFKEDSVASRTGTEELLLYRDILETVLLTAFQGGKLAKSSDDMARGLQELCWQDGRVRSLPRGQPGLRLFDPLDGNRNDGTGEHIVVLRPDEGGFFAQATITLWHLESNVAQRGTWRLVRTLRVNYDTLASDRPGG